MELTDRKLLVRGQQDAAKRKRYRARRELINYFIPTYGPKILNETPVSLRKKAHQLIPKMLRAKTICPPLHETYLQMVVDYHRLALLITSKI